VQGCRQPGSAWKPLVYAAALERGAITQGTPLRDAPIVAYDQAMDVHWRPRAGKHYRGVALAADALAASLNAPAIEVMDRVGPDGVIDLARRLGINTEVDDVRPMALGTSCVRPIELARAYAILARRGWPVAARFITRIRRGDDVIIDYAVPEDPHLDPTRRFDRLAATAGLPPDERIGAPRPGRVLDEASAFLIDDLLTGPVQRGTATAARGLGRPVAGKTGTTNDNTDAWFVGFSARTTLAVWVGHDRQAVELGPRDDGAHAAAVARRDAARRGRAPARAGPGGAPARAGAGQDRPRDGSAGRARRPRRHAVVPARLSARRRGRAAVGDRSRSGPPGARVLALSWPRRGPLLAPAARQALAR
jgi:penicillin-binding protein 1A